MRLVLVGDVMLGRLVNQAMLGRPPGWIWRDTVKSFRSAHWRACNLECVLTHRTNPALLPKAFHFRADPSNIRALKAAGFDAVSIANNHVLDFGEEALIERSSGLMPTASGTLAPAATWPKPSGQLSAKSLDVASVSSPRPTTSPAGRPATPSQASSTYPLRTDQSRSRNACCRQSRPRASRSTC